MNIKVSIMLIKGDIVIAHVITNQSYYDIFYLDQADLSYAEVIYTVDGQQLAPVQLDLVDAKICYHQAQVMIIA